MSQTCRHIAYFIIPDNFDPVPPVVVNIEPLNEEPVRPPTPEASPVNEPNPVIEAPPLPSPPIQNLPLLNNMAQNQALQDAANAMNALAIAMGQAMAYIKNNAQEWASSLANAPNHFQNDNYGQNDNNGHSICSFVHIFKERFMIPKQKAIWQKQLFEIKQGTDIFFIQGLCPKYAINVQAAEPADLEATITEARKWENGKLMATADTETSTTQAIDKLSKQIAKLSINLAERQANPTPILVYYFEENQK
ncbi:29371_t:CDS:2 [Gigaspora margarita]|uniref:29371_t:CDS:1 n=1 Tax=Gigaspora margarita TaxID=4874 RepID=A0ABN7UW77_GIGMA|nr:29371_t:CDS:2 [Gigaspora margarita]